MWLGFLLICLAGICWIGSGIVVSVCAKRGVSYNIVQLVSCSILVPVSFAIMYFLDGFRCSLRIYLIVMIICFIGGIGNYFTFLLTEAAMKRGPNGLVWGIVQSGMIGTFLMGVFMFNEKASFISWCSLFLTVSGVILSGLKNKKGADVGQNPHGFAWLFFSLAGMFFLAITQCLVGLPSFIEGASEAGSAFRVMTVSMGTIIAFCIVTLPGLLKRHEFKVTKQTWYISVITAGIAVLSSILLFIRGVDLLAAAGCGGLGYPVAIGISLIGFSVYSLCILREKLSKIEIIGLAAVTLGIIGMSLR